MKFNAIYALTLAGFVSLTACQEDESKLTATSPIIEQAQQTEFIFTAENATDSLVLRWQRSSGDDFMPLQYNVEMAIDTEFSKPIAVGSTSADSISIAYGDINRELIRSGAPSDTELNVFCRVAATLGDKSGKLISANQQLTITLYSVAAYETIAIAGANNGWNPAGEENTLLYSPSNDGIYTGYIAFAQANGEFKICPDHKWGTDMGGADGIISGSANIKVDTVAGLFLFTVDMNELTYKTTLCSWGIIGLNGDWDNDIELTATENPLILKADVVCSGSTNFKFRANNDWTIQYGASSKTDGTAVPNGGDIKIESAGTYTLSLDLSVYPYKYSISETTL